MKVARTINPSIRALDPISDLERVTAFYAQAPDYWLMADGVAPGAQKAKLFFTDGPPGCDPDVSYRLGLFLETRLSGLAELSFGFPDAGDAYLGFLMLGPWARDAGLGRVFLSHIEVLARRSQAPQIFLAVLEANTKGRAFWEREGFVATGLSGISDGHVLHRLAKSL